MPGNLPRVVPDGLDVKINRGSWKMPPIFRYLQEAGEVSDAEMADTFNMGIGFAVIVRKKDIPMCLGLLPGSKLIGEVVKGKGASKLVWS